MPKSQKSAKDGQQGRKEEAKSATVLSRLGPGLITGAADDDPSGIATYSQVGAVFGGPIVSCHDRRNASLSVANTMLRFALVDNRGRRFGTSGSRRARA